jgi:hypothetical protein
MGTNMLPKNVRRVLTCSVVAGAAALLVSAAGAADSQVSILPINFDHLKTWTASDVSHGDNLNMNEGDNQAVSFYIEDLGTNSRWEFPQGDKEFYNVLMKLHAVSGDNVTQLAYVSGGAHGAWVAPLSGGKSAANVSGQVDVRQAYTFDPNALNVKWSESAHDYVLTDGKRTIAEISNGQDPSPFRTLQAMIKTYGLNSVMAISSDVSTPVGTGGPLLVFLKLNPDSTMAANEKKGWWPF